jgi:hypothetical protein
MALQESFERCQIDDLDCADLCSAVYELMNGKDSAEYVSFSACELIDLDGQPAVHYTVNYECVGGRLPPGAMLKDDKCATTETGAWFANLAELEEASVYAFVMLSKELKRFGAPDTLVARCRTPAADEANHTRLVSALAERFGARLTPIEMPNLPENRGLHAVALENAREGCVRETYGALVGVWQSKHSRDPVVREVMSRIAIDESRHAELSADIDSWARTQLSASEQKALDAERQEALRQLVARGADSVSQELIDMAGLPDADSNSRLLQLAQTQIWS